MKSNITKALLVVDGLISSHQCCAKGMREASKDWPNNTKSLAVEIALVNEEVIRCMEYIKKYLLEEKKTKK